MGRAIFRVVVFGVVLLAGAGAMGKTPAWVHASPTVHYVSAGALLVAALALAAILGAKPKQQQTRQPRPRAGRPW